MRPIAWAVIVASFNMMPPPSQGALNSSGMAAASILIFILYGISWCGFLNSLWSDK